MGTFDGPNGGFYSEIIYIRQKFLHCRYFCLSGRVSILGRSSVYETSTNLTHFELSRFATMLCTSTCNKEFWTPGLPQGVLSNCPCPSVHGWWSVGPWSVRPSLNISETAYWFFLIFLHEIRAP